VAELDRRADRSPVPSAFDYASAPESREVVQLEERYGLFIGGELVEPRSGEFHPSLSPSSEEELTTVAYAGPEDVDDAVQAARGAFDDGWSSLEA
jgi:aldehyde dehydrogenase (NAD+)